MMGRFRSHFLPAILLLVIVGSVARAQEDEAFHEFSNKDGVKIEAKIVSLTPDWKTMKIQRRDGKEFDMPVNVLSLDDQQVVKKWIKANPTGAMIDINLAVDIEKKSKTLKNGRTSLYKYKTSEVAYEVNINNRSREELAGARADYVVIFENAVKMGRDDDGDLNIDSVASGKGEIEYVRKSEILKESLSFNHEHVFLTEKVPQEVVVADATDEEAQDKILGVIIRVVDARDQLVGEYRSSEAYVQKVEWEEVKGDAFGSDPAGASGTPGSPAPAPPTSSVNPDSMEPRQLDAWPESFAQGDAVPASVVPQWGGKSVRLSAMVDINEEEPAGTLISNGGIGRGFALYIHEKALHLRSKRILEDNESEDRTISVALSELPAEEFKLNALYDESSLKIWVNDEIKAEGASIGLLNINPREGLSVGFDSEETAVGPVEPPHRFAGTIREVKVQFGE